MPSMCMVMGKYSWERLTYLNWQKISAYSAEILDACKTVTLKVKLLPILRCSTSPSIWASTGDFNGLSRSSWVATEWRQNHKHSLRYLPPISHKLKMVVMERWWGSFLFPHAKRRFLYFTSPIRSLWFSANPNPNYLLIIAILIHSVITLSFSWKSAA